MLRTVGDAPTLWETILPPAMLGMPAELEAVDRLLDDPRFFEPYRAFFHEWLGRPSIPIETYLRLMFLMYRYRLGFEPLCRVVQDSITWLALWQRRDRRVERGVVGESGRGAGAQDEPGAGGHDGGGSERRVPDRFGFV